MASQTCHQAYLNKDRRGAAVVPLSTRQGLEGTPFLQPTRFTYFRMQKAAVIRQGHFETTDARLVGLITRGRYQ